MIYVFLMISIFLFYIIFFTPYPFVWMIRRDKGSKRSKSPENIEEIKAQVDITLGLKYPSKFHLNTYDLYLPKEKPNKTFIIWLHGGSFVAGTSYGMHNYGPMLAEKGYSVCAMNYALAPESIFPTQIIQIDEMIHHIVNNYEVESIVLGGDSAGANIAAMYGAIYQNDKLKKEVNITLNNPMPIDQLILLCGPYDFTEDYTRDVFKEFKTFMKYIGWSYLGHRDWLNGKTKYLASPLLHLNENYPPTFIVDGKKYSFMWQGKKFAETLRKYNVPVQSSFYEELGHEFQFDFEENPVEAHEVFTNVIEFLEGEDKYV